MGMACASSGSPRHMNVVFGRPIPSAPEPGIRTCHSDACTSTASREWVRKTDHAPPRGRGHRTLHTGRLEPGTRSNCLRGRILGCLCHTVSPREPSRKLRRPLACGRSLLSYTPWAMASLIVLVTTLVIMAFVQPRQYAAAQVDGVAKAPIYARINDWSESGMVSSST